MKLRSLVFHQSFVLIVSIVAAAACAIWITVRHRGTGRFDLLFYLVPIVVPFVAFLFDRAACPSRLTLVSLAIDTLVVAIALARSAGHVPLVSGHSLFLTYALLSTESRVARISAAIVMIQVLILKVFVWHDVVSLAGGVLLGSIAAMITRWHVAKIQDNQGRKVGARLSP